MTDIVRDDSALDDSIKKRKQKHSIPIKDLLSSGSTLLNLAATGRTSGCFIKGKYYWIVGDSTAGKTFCALTCLAEANINSNFDDYRLIYDNIEDGALMDIARFFGPGVASRLEPPSGTRDSPIYSNTTNDLFYNIDDALQRDEPFIYIVDSMDALETNEDKEKFKEMKSASRKGKEASGSYGMSKAKTNSAFIRRIVAGCRDTSSIVIIISQTRDNVGFGSQFEPKRASGGRSLRFYATLEMWLSVKQKIRKTIKGKPRQLGVISKVQLKKNRITGKDRTVLIPIYHSVGIDDLGSCIDFLIEERYWSGKESTVSAPEFDFSGSKEKLIQRIENADEEKELKSIVSRVWREIEKESEIRRKPKYGQDAD